MSSDAGPWFVAGAISVLLHVGGLSAVLLIKPMPAPAPPPEARLEVISLPVTIANPVAASIGLQPAETRAPVETIRVPQARPLRVEPARSIDPVSSSTLAQTPAGPGEAPVTKPATLEPARVAATVEEVASPTLEPRTSSPEVRAARTEAVASRSATAVAERSAVAALAPAGDRQEGLQPSQPSPLEPRQAASLPAAPMEAEQPSSPTAASVRMPAQVAEPVMPIATPQAIVSVSPSAAKPSETVRTDSRVVASRNAAKIASPTTVVPALSADDRAGARQPAVPEPRQAVSSPSARMAVETPRASIAAAAPAPTRPAEPVLPTRAQSQALASVSPPSEAVRTGSPTVVARGSAGRIASLTAGALSVAASSTPDTGRQPMNLPRVVGSGLTPRPEAAPTASASTTGDKGRQAGGQDDAPSTGEDVAMLAPPRPVAEPQPDRYADALNFLKGHDGGWCFLVLPALRDGVLGLDGFADAPGRLADFQQIFEAEIHGRVETVSGAVSAAQCRALAFARNLARYPGFSLGMKLQSRIVPNGGLLVGSVVHADGSPVHLLLVDDEGKVQNLDRYATPRGRDIVFSAPMTLTAGPVRTAQLLVAITGPERLDTIDRLNGQPAEGFFSELTEELARRGVAADLAMASFFVE